MLVLCFPPHAITTNHCFTLTFGSSARSPWFFDSSAAVAVVLSVATAVLLAPAAAAAGGLRSACEFGGLGLGLLRVRVRVRVT